MADPSTAQHLADLVRAQGGLLTPKEAVAAGVSKSALQWARRTKVLFPLRSGVFTTTQVWEDSSAEARHLLQVRAQQRVNPDQVASSTSAAILLRLPTPSGPPPEPRLTVPRALAGPEAHGRRRSGALARLAWLTPSEIWTDSKGVRSTSPVRTVLDCAREWDDQAWGLAIADAVLAKWPGTELAPAARARPPAPGHRRALWVAEHARPAVESPLESLARADIVEAGLPEPTPQVWVTTPVGDFRVDLMDTANGLVTEADGRAKYVTRGDLWEEKRREDALRDQGLEVVRYTMADHRSPARWLDRYRRALERCARGSASVSSKLERDQTPKQR